MTIDEAIIHAENVARNYDCKCGQDHQQLAEWLKELKWYKSADEQDDNRLYIKIYADDEPSRKAEKLYQICGETESQEVAQWLKEYFPSADRPTGWIPVSERLPERNEIVLVSYKTTDTVHMCKYLDDGSENPWWSYNDDCLAWNNVVLAWMPLPQPYGD